jgi:hypothetical protein
MKYNIIILTETMLTTEWSIKGTYTIHRFAEQGQAGRPKGSITCMLKPGLSPFATINSTEHILLVKTSTLWIMGIYFKLESASIGIIDEIGTALSKVEPDSPLILGDPNCRIDTPGAKATAVLEYLEETGLKLIN